MRTTAGAPWRAKRATLGFFLMHEAGEGALWRWVTDDRGARVRFDLAVSRDELVAAAGVRPGWYQLIPIDRAGQLTQDPPAMIAATGGPAAEVLGAGPSIGGARAGDRLPPHASPPVSDRLFRTLRRPRPGHRPGH